MNMNRWIAGMLAVVAVCSLAPRASAVDDATHAKATASIAEGIEFLRKAQAEDGSWSAQPAGPAVTALVLTAMIDQPGITESDPAVQKALQYILSRQKPDGGIYGEMLANYNTSICLSALSRFRGDAKVEAAIEKGEKFLRGLQITHESGDDVHVGGVGYGKHGRPDGSNTQFFAQALHDLGCEEGDPAMQGAVEFFTRLQGTSANKVNGDKIVQDGGAIYAPSVNKDLKGVPQSMASPEMVEAAKAGQPVSNLRTYGSMTYAMFKTYVYAQMPRDDIRIRDAVKWVSNNYAVDHNPGMSEDMKLQGHYYYLVTMARALRAWGEPIKAADGNVINWQTDIVNQIEKMQREDGSWINEADRWMEGDPNMVSAFAIIAMTEAIQ